MPVKKRSFRLSEAQAEIICFCLDYFIIDTEDIKDFCQAHREGAKRITKKLKEYEWSVEE